MPSLLVEQWFSRAAFPWISTFFSLIADAVPIAWLDVLLVSAILYIGVCVWRRRWLTIAVAVAAGYLVFFWSWGLNYHRVPVAEKLSLDQSATSNPAIQAFTRLVAAQMNALYIAAGQRNYDEDQIRSEAASRVARVVQKLDGKEWLAPRRVKVSVLANPWFRMAGIDGIFNPLIHEPIINSRVLAVERPFVISHELAHVRGYPDEGDANFLALMATLLSDSPRFQYSGWLHLWLYLRSSDLDALLDPGPRQDVQRIFDRFRREQIVWVANLQGAILDLFLKVNSVSEGVRSYSRVVVLAAGTQQTWERFR